MNEPPMLSAAAWKRPGLKKVKKRAEETLVATPDCLQPWLAPAVMTGADLTLLF